MIERIQSLFKLFTELTGNPVMGGYAQIWAAREWLNAGFTEDDLRTMVKYRHKTVKEPGILKAMLRWRFLIEDTQRFAEDLPEARAYFRQHKAASNRQKVLELTGRNGDAPKDNTRTAGQVLSEAGKKAFEEFQRFRREQLER